MPAGRSLGAPARLLLQRSQALSVSATAILGRDSAPLCKRAAPGEAFRRHYPSQAASHSGGFQVITTP